MGIRGSSGTVYIIDYGLAKKYRDANTRMHIPYRDNKRLTGTARYASLFTHMGAEQSRRDDLECLGYSMVYLLNGELPWQGTQAENRQEKYHIIKEKKTSIKLEELCKGLPIEFVRYIRYCRSLKFEDRPDYAQLKKLFKDLFYQKRLNVNFKFDWVELGINIEELHPESCSDDETNLAECPVRRCCIRLAGTGHEIHVTELSSPKTIATANPFMSNKSLSQHHGVLEPDTPPGEPHREHESIAVLEEGKQRSQTPTVPERPPSLVIKEAESQPREDVKSQHEDFADLALKMNVSSQSQSVVLPPPEQRVEAEHVESDSCDLNDRDIIEDLAIYSTNLDPLAF